MESVLLELWSSQKAHSPAGCHGSSEGVTQALWPGAEEAWGPLLCGEGVVWVRWVCTGHSHMELEFRVRGMALTQ